MADLQLLALSQYLNKNNLINEYEVSQIDSVHYTVQFKSLPNADAMVFHVMPCDSGEHTNANTIIENFSGLTYAITRGLQHDPANTANHEPDLISTPPAHASKNNFL